MISFTLVFLACFFSFSCHQKKKCPDYLNQNIPIETRVADLVSRLTIDEKISLLYVTQPAIERLGIKEYHYGNEALHGIVRRNGQATVFPQAIALASTWNPELIFNCATAISDEARAKHNANEGKMKGGEIWGGQFDGLLTFFSPTINMARDPRWGRTAETYGEDPFLTGEIAKAFIKGMQGDHEKYLKTICTPKHFAANNEEHNRFEANALISEKTLREYYLPAFRTSIVEAGAGAIMSAYNAINGIPCTANKWLLNDILRDEWGFKGYVVCDCGALKHLYESHHYASSPLEASVMSLKAGVDLECGSKKDLSGNIKEALAKKFISMEEVDKAASNILRGQFLLGMFDKAEDVPYNQIPEIIVGNKEHQELARQAARESIVLLKNGCDKMAGLLPIDKTRKQKILVIGPNANACQFGERNYSGVPVIDPVTPLEGIREEFGKISQIEYIPWMDFQNNNKFMVVNRSILPDREESGFSGEYYHNADFKGTPDFTRTDPVISFDWKNMPPDPFLPVKNFSIRWSGIVKNTMGGEYWFKVSAKGNYSLFLNGVSVIKNSKQNEIKSDSVKINVKDQENIEIRLLFSSDSGNDPSCKLEWKFNTGETDFFAPYIEKAGQSDLIIAFLGLDSETVVEGKDREDLNLPEDQLQLIKKLHVINKRIVVVLINGNPLSINWMAQNVPSIIEAWFPGESGGTAISEVLSGKYNPAGRLPLTFYKSIDQLPPFNSYEISEGHTYMYLKEKPLYPFGHGLSYTKFKYDDFSVVQNNMELDVEICVTNAGKFDGDEVIQLYFAVDSPKNEYPIKKLFAFKRVNIISGETRKVNFKINPGKSFSFFNPDSKKFELPDDNIIIMAGSSSAIIQKTVNLKLQGID